MVFSRQNLAGLILIGGIALGGAGIYALNRSQNPPPEKRLYPLPLGSVKPGGWLERQLRIHAAGLTGHLDEFWPDIRDSGWMGGPGEGWERGPYWLDGLVPLAYLTDDAGLLYKVQKWMDYVLTHQAADGWLGPDQSPPSKMGHQFPVRDPWPAFVFLKALAQYGEASGDPRVVPAMLFFLRNLDVQLTRRALFSWSHFRSTELLWILEWLRTRSGDPVLASLAEKEKIQGYDWRKHFSDLPVKTRSVGWTFEGHVVNNAMGLKGSGNRKESLKALAALDRWHGQATGIFTGDECFAGKMPSQGTELCAVVEMLFSLETLGARYQEANFFERMEKVAYNALPATFKKDGWAHQYVQQANQAVVKISPERVYTTNDPDANIFGLEPNYGCCTANMHQGWPKFASHLWMSTPDGGLAAAAWAPSAVQTRIQGAGVQIEVRTDYPFSEKIEIEVATDRAVTFPLLLRVPSWAKGATLEMQGSKTRKLKAGAFHRISREWSGTQSCVLTLPMGFKIERRFNKSVSIERGPLVYSLRIKEEWRKLRGEEPHADWEVFPRSPWNYALALDEGHLEKSLSFSSSPVGAIPFSPEQAPVRLSAKARRLPAWGLEKNAAAPPPMSPVKSSEPLEEVELIPYGATNLRITEFPVLGE